MASWSRTCNAENLRPIQPHNVLTLDKPQDAKHTTWPAGP